MKKNLGLIITALLFSINVSSQIRYANEETMIFKKFDKKDHSNDNIEGSPYLFNDFKEGQVLFKNQEEPQTYILNYDAHSNQILFQKDEEVYYASNVKSIDKIVINDTILIYIEYKNGDEEKRNFFIELFSDEIKLYKSVDIKFIPKREPRNTYDSGEPAKFVKLKPEYYISINNEKATLIRNKKSLLKTFSEVQDLKTFMKNKRLNINQENDLIDIIEYINQQYKMN